MLFRGTLFVTLITVILGTEVIEESKGINREGKTWGKFPILKLVMFENTPCKTTSGVMGTCLTEWECSKIKGGTAEGDCADDYGVCCNDGTAPYEGGDTTITEEGGDFFNPSDSDEELLAKELRQDDCVPYTATLKPAETDVQIKIDIRNLDIMGPTDGDCTNDTMEIIGANPGLKIPILCGKITDQTLYIGIDNSAPPYEIIITLCGNYSASWNISISFMDEGDPGLAPPRCLQYMTETIGAVQSFNYEGNLPMMINDQVYSICFKYISGYCDVGFNFARLDLGNVNGICDDEFLLIGNEKLCGDYIGNPTAIANASTVILMNVVSNNFNDMQMEGFSATYSMMGC